MPDDRTPFELVANYLGDTPAEVAGWDRLLAGAREAIVARANLDLAASECAGAIRNFADAWIQSERRLIAAEADEIAAHPDLVEVNVELDARYDLP